MAGACDATFVGTSIIAVTNLVGNCLAADHMFSVETLQANFAFFNNTSRIGETLHPAPYNLYLVGILMVSKLQTKQHDTHDVSRRHAESGKGQLSTPCLTSPRAGDQLLKVIPTPLVQLVS